MASAALSDADSLRVNLETAISKLRKTLQYWQKWEAEYEGLKEELESEKNEPSAEDMVRIGAEYGSDVVDEKEIKELVNYNKTTRRNRSQVLSAISGRIDTGQKNAELVQKQIDRAEDRLELALAANSPVLRNEDGQPLMEIEEELDENGNIICKCWRLTSTFCLLANRLSSE
jgi:unconventional prefoldin RPB5 interactor 1